MNENNSSDCNTSQPSLPEIELCQTPSTLFPESITFIDLPLKYGRIVESPTHHSISFPFCRIPSEMFAVIFSHCLPASPGEHLAPKVLVKLMSVCREWRDIIQNTPSLWTSLHISTDDPEISAHLPSILARSGVCTLHVEISDLSTSTRKGKTLTEKEDSIWHNFSFAIHRVHTLVLTVNEAEHPIMRTLLSAPNSTISLKHLKVSLWNKRRRSALESSNGRAFLDAICRCSDLRTFTLINQNKEFANLSFAQLPVNTWAFLSKLRLTLLTSSSRDTLSILLAAPQLRHFEMRSDVFATRPLGPINVPVAHCSLLQLKFGSSITPTLKFVLLPSLEVLTIGDEFDCDDLPSMTASCILPSSGFNWQSLKVLRMHVPGIPSSYMLSFLAGSPCLQTLHIEWMVDHRTLLGVPIIQPFTHLGLEVLKIVQNKSQYGAVTAFFDLVTLPNLTQLAIHQIMPTSRKTKKTNGLSLLYFIRRSHPLLQKLLLENQDITEGHLISIVTECPMLTYLEITERLLNSIIGALNPQVRSRGNGTDSQWVLCTKLSALRLLGQVTSHDGLVGEMVQARYKNGVLRRVQIEFAAAPHPLDEAIFRRLQKSGLKITWVTS